MTSFYKSQLFPRQAHMSTSFPFVSTVSTI